MGLSYGKDADKEVEEVESIPVGYEVPIMMYSLDFEEFLWAYGYSDANMDFSCPNLSTPSLPLRYNEKDILFIITSQTMKWN